MMKRPDTPYRAEIVAKRKSLGLDQAEFAARLDVAHSTVWRWEQGRMAPTKRMLKQIRRLR